MIFFETYKDRQDIISKFVVNILTYLESQRSILSFSLLHHKLIKL